MYVLVVASIVLAGVPHLVDGILGGRVAEPVRSFIALVAALGLAALTVGPFVGEVLAARTGEPPG